MTTISLEFPHLKTDVVIQQFLCNFAIAFIEPGQSGEATGSVVNEELLVDQVDQVLRG